MSKNKLFAGKLGKSTFTFMLGAMLMVSVTAAVAQTQNPPAGDINATFDSVNTPRIFSTTGSVNINSPLEVGTITNPRTASNRNVIIDDQLEVTGDLEVNGSIYSDTPGGSPLTIDSDLILKGSLLPDPDSPYSTFNTLPVSGNIMSSGIGRLLWDADPTNGSPFKIYDETEFKGPIIGSYNPASDPSRSGSENPDLPDWGTGLYVDSNLNVADNLSILGNTEITGDLEVAGTINFNNSIQQPGSLPVRIEDDLTTVGLINNSGRIITSGSIEAGLDITTSGGKIGSFFTVGDNTQIVTVNGFTTNNYSSVACPEYTYVVSCGGFLYSNSPDVFHNGTSIDEEFQSCSLILSSSRNITVATVTEARCFDPSGELVD